MSRSWWSPSVVRRAGEADEVGRDQLRALVDQLVVGVLAVRAGLAPDDRPGLHVDRARRPASPTCRCSPCRAAGGRPGAGRGTGCRAAPRASRRRRSRRTRCRSGPSASAGSPRSARCGSARPSAWKPASISPNRSAPIDDHQRQPDRRVEGVAAADPVPEPEHVVGVDAELRRPRRWSTPRRSAWRPPRRRRASASDQSRAVLGVGHRLERGERLRHDDEERLGRVEVVHRLPEVGAVDVGHEAERQVAVG